MTGTLGRDAVLVTGASGGIGRAIAERLGDEGTTVIAHYATNSTRAIEVADLINSRGGRCVTAQADLRKDDDIDRLVGFVGDFLAENDMTLSGLVNNAAKLLSPGFFDTTSADFDEFFALNARAPFFLAQRLAPLMRTGGSIVNISSAGAHFSSPGDIVYSMTKAAVESLTANAAEALAPLGIRINNVVPGFTDNGHPAFQIPQAREYMSSFAVLGDVSQPGAVADAVGFLLSGRASRTTGSTLDASGGSILGVHAPAAFSFDDVG